MLLLQPAESKYPMADGYMRMFRIYFFPLILFIILASSRNLFGITADELALQVEKKYRLLSDLSMNFTKVTSSEIFETPSKVQGKMILKNPDKFKIETKEETITCDGKFIWTYTVGNQQVVKNLVDRSEDLFKPNQVLSDFRSDYTPSLVGEEKVNETKCFKLLLTSKKEDVFIKKMTVWVDQQNLLARRLEYRDSQDNDIIMDFRNIKTNRKIKDSEFVFQTPPGVEELDLSK